MHGKRVLIVDDDKLICWCVSRTLGPRNVAIHAVSSVRDAIAEITGKSYDLVLLDINLPDGNGLDLLEAIRTISPATKAIILSGDASEGNRERALSGGALRFIEKPFDNDLLIDAARSALGGAA